MPNAFGPCGDLASDASHANQAERLAFQLGAGQRLLVPDASFHRRIGRRHGAREASISASACSATLMLFAPGAFMTRIPRAVAADRSTLSTPVPARAITRRRGADCMSRSSTFVALRTISASADARSAASASLDRPERESTVQPGILRDDFYRGCGELICNDDVHNPSYIMCGCAGRGYRVLSHHDGANRRKLRIHAARMGRSRLFSTNFSTVSVKIR